MQMLVDSGFQPIVVGAREAEEVIQNVRMILTTPKGSVPLDRDFGLSFTVLDQPTPRARALMEAEIVRLVGKYEPRARVLRVAWAREEAEAMEGRTFPKVTIEVRQ